MGKKKTTCKGHTFDLNSKWARSRHRKIHPNCQKAKMWRKGPEATQFCSATAKKDHVRELGKARKAR